MHHTENSTDSKVEENLANHLSRIPPSLPQLEQELLELRHFEGLKSECQCFNPRKTFDKEEEQTFQIFIGEFLQLLKEIVRRMPRPFFLHLPKIYEDLLIRVRVQL